jgi:hypothetical protein
LQNQDKSVIIKQVTHNKFLGLIGVLVSSTVFKTACDLRARLDEFDSHAAPPNHTYQGIEAFHSLSNKPRLIPFPRFKCHLGAKRLVLTIRYPLRHQILQWPVPGEKESHDYTNLM